MIRSIDFLKNYYQIKLRMEQLNERDRVSVLVIVVSVLFGLWFLVIYHPQKNSIVEINQHSQVIEIQTSVIRQKISVIKALLGNADTEKLILLLKELTSKRDDLEKKFSHYQQRYISSRDLGKLLHDMLIQTFGVTIVDFATVVQVTPPQTQQTTQAPPVQETAVKVPPMEYIHYRLVLRGHYFPIMNYLKRLESLGWGFYWDKFDYSVKEYPDGTALIEFYTIKPQAISNIALKGGSQ